MKKLLYSLLISLLIGSPLSSEQVTTGNLLDQNFDNGSWSGTADGRHGSNTIAAEHNTYIQSDSVSLRNDAGLNQDQINDGFTTNHTFKYWHWNDYTSRVQSTVTVTGADGETITQIRNYDSTGCGGTNCGSYVNGGDTIDISRNIQTDYGISVKYDFTDSSQSTTSHYGVDLKEPSLTVTYESDPVRIDNTTITSLNTSFAKVEDDLKFEDDFKFENTTIIKEEEKFEEFKFEESFTEEAPKFEEYETPQMQEELETKTLPEEMKFTESSEPSDEKTDDSLVEFFDLGESDQKEEKSEEAPSSLLVEQKSDEEEDTSTETSEESGQKTEAESDNKSNVSDEKKVIALDKVMNKIDEKVKDIGENLKVKNLVKINAMVDNNILLGYNKPFYKEFKIYERQIDIQDNRVIYTANLETYTRADPISVQRNKIMDIRLQKQKLQQEIEVLKNEF